MITTFSINGQSYRVDLASLPGDITLNTFIRDHAGLSGTKFMCQEGGCGVCICVVTRKDPVSGELKTRAVNSCLTLLNTCVDSEITTSEGIGNKRDGFHPIQDRLAKMNGTQCGYCSPGMVMNMYGLLNEHKGKVTMETIEDSFGGNLCRCTGYRPILDAMKSFATDSNIQIPAECRDIEDLSNYLCPKTGKACDCPSKSRMTTLTCHNGEQWFWPITLQDLSSAFAKLDDDNYMLVAGNTAHGVYRRSKNINKFIDISAIATLHEYSISGDSLILGGNMSLTDAMEVFKKASKKSGFEYCSKLWDHFDLIANVPVRNMGTLAGNLSIKHQHPDFPSDIHVVFEALDVQVVLLVGGQEKKVSLSEFLRTNMNKKVIKSFILRPYKPNEYLFDSYKIMPRAQNAHAYVNAAFLVQLNCCILNKRDTKVKSARICYGGLSDEFSHATQLEKCLINKDLFHSDSIRAAFTSMQKELVATEFRIKLAEGLFYKFLLANAPSGKVSTHFLSGGAILKRPISSGQQLHHADESSFPIKRPTEKHEGLLQCSGEAMFSNDLPPQSQQLWAAFVTAKKIGATVVGMDTSEALKIPGVVAVLTAADIPGKNRIAEVDNIFFMEEEKLFLEGEVKFYGQPVALIVADTNSLAYEAAELVKLTYKGGAKEVFPSMEDVINGGPAERIRHVFKSDTSEAGTSKEAAKQSEESFDVASKGTLNMGLQYHFFMEPQTTVALPTEGGLLLYCATQWMDLTQVSVSHLLGLNNNEVQLKISRIGGGYGGKATRCLPAAGAAALAAYKLKRPVRFVQSLESMMESLGKRWACNTNYTFNAKKSGKLVKLNIKFYEDAGYSPNDSPMGHTALLSRNCYQFTPENYILDGYMVMTDSPTNTACRAPGSLEAIAMIENVMEHTAFELGLDPFDVRMANLMGGHKIAEMIPRFLETSQYKERRQDVLDFNKKHRWTKRGVGLAIMEYQVGYFGQYPATVAIYHGDGSVVISHGGVEMGQGMTTKIAQVVSHLFEIPLSLVRVEGSNTINGANAMVTGGSIGSESVCFAVRKCCRSLLERLAPIREELKDPSWKDLINKAHAQNMTLVASDGCKTGEMDPYTVCSLGLTEVQMDVLTGNYVVTRVDILQDAGESLNPTCDIGQVEGAFIMGLGYWTTELCQTDKVTGQLTTNRTWNYKPPGAKDIPVDFRIELLANSTNPKGFMGSKATGEPSICLAVNVSFALQQAIQSARDDAGLTKKWVNLTAPMTPEHVILSCGTDVNMMTLMDKA